MDIVLAHLLTKVCFHKILQRNNPKSTKTSSTSLQEPLTLESFAVGMVVSWSGTIPISVYICRFTKSVFSNGLWRERERETFALEYCLLKQQQQQQKSRCHGVGKMHLLLPNNYKIMVWNEHERLEGRKERGIIIIRIIGREMSFYEQVSIWILLIPK